MTVRQRVSSVLEDEALVIERIEAQFRHLNSVQDVVGGLERVKFCNGVNFLAFGDRPRGAENVQRDR